MKALNISCPHCREMSELYLVSKPYMMVLNCPDCQSTLLHCEGSTYEIDDMKVIQMERQQIQNFVESLKEKSQFTSSLPSEPAAVASKSLVATKSHAMHRMGEAVRENSLRQDDILNLKISLESCQDVSEFIEQI